MRNDHDAKLRRSLLLALVVGALCAGPAFRAWADDPWRTTVLEENDSLFFNTDKHYTQGLRLSLLSPALKERGWADDLFDFAGAIPTVFAEDKTRTRRDSLFLGQSIFTPENLDIKPPNPRDRPYGGWLYAGTSMLQETGNQLENFELDLGVVGPAALGRQTQNDFHQFIDIHQAQGWSSQIQNEPGLVVSYERLWRLPVIGVGDTSHGVENGIDVVPQLGGSAGNVFTYGEAGGLLRIGRHLEADYGPVRIRPALSGTDYFNPEPLGDDTGYYIFAGAQGRIVGHNIFLDGNTFRQSPSVTRKTFVADLQTGVSVYWSSSLRLDASVVRRTEEFEGQRTPDVIETVAASFSW
jgi:lipid A 3-O-deacylase